MNTSLLILIILSIGLSAVWVTVKINQTRKVIMSKLSDLASALAAIDAENVAAIAAVQSLQASLAALQQQLANVTLPTDAQAALDKLTADAASLAATVNPPAPTPAPTNAA